MHPVLSSIQRPDPWPRPTIPTANRLSHGGAVHRQELGSHRRAVVRRPQPRHSHDFAQTTDMPTIGNPGGGLSHQRDACSHHSVALDSISRAWAGQSGSAINVWIFRAISGVLPSMSSLVRSRAIRACVAGHLPPVVSTSAATRVAHSWSLSGGGVRVMPRNPRLPSVSHRSLASCWIRFQYNGPRLLRYERTVRR